MFFLHPPPLVACMVVRQYSEVPVARAAGITHLSPSIPQEFSPLSLTFRRM